MASKDTTSAKIISTLLKVEQRKWGGGGGGVRQGTTSTLGKHLIQKTDLSIAVRNQGDVHDVCYLSVCVVELFSNEQSTAVAQKFVIQFQVHKRC